MCITNTGNQVVIYSILQGCNMVLPGLVKFCTCVIAIATSLHYYCVMWAQPWLCLTKFLMFYNIRKLVKMLLDKYKMGLICMHNFNIIQF